jgi:N-acetylneuraminic acid mutarotase
VAEVGQLPEPRAFASAEFVGRALHVVGGAANHHDLSTTRATLLIRPNTVPSAAWERGPDLPGRPRALMASASLSGAMYVFGGCYLDDAGAVRNLGETWRYEARTRQWSRCADSPYAARAWEAVALDDRYALICGGYVATSEEAAEQGPAFGFTDQVLLYDADRDRFRVVGSQPLPAVTSAPVLHGRRLYLTGGEHRMRARTDQAAVATIRHTAKRP